MRLCDVHAQRCKITQHSPCVASDVLSNFCLWCWRGNSSKRLLRCGSRTSYVHWIYINTKAERHELTSMESHFTKHNPSLCSSSICSQKVLERGFAFAIFIMRVTARRLPISICARQTRVRDIGSVFNSHTSRLYAKYSTLIGRCSRMQSDFDLFDWQMQSGSWPPLHCSY
jgi:hypothetical protein